MQLFNSVVRKYTPPTCTLEVKARESPLSRWVPLKVLKQLTFELYIDDPRHQQGKHVSLWGDGEELEMLQEAVSAYVQDLIEKSHNQLELALGQPASQSSSTQLLPEQKSNHHLKALPPAEANLARLAPAEEAEVEEISSRSDLEPSQPRLMLAASPYLKPRGLLAHDLVLGPLETDESGPVISLSVLQLFDLATALDEYAADVMVMPSLSSAPLTVQNRPIWIYAAAGAVVAAVGLTLALGQMFSRSKQQPQTVVMSPTQQPALNEDAQIAGDSLPPSVSPTPLASPSPGSTPLLPPAPGATTISPNSPNSAVVPAPSNSASLPTAPGLGQPSLGNNPQISSSSLPFNPPTSPQIPTYNSSPNLPNSSFQQPSSRINTRSSFSIPSFNSNPPIKVVTPRKPTSVAKKASRPSVRIATSPKPKTSVSRPPLRIVTPPEPDIAFLPPQRVTPKASAPPSSIQLRPGRSTGTSGLPQLSPSPIPPTAFNPDPLPQTSLEPAPSIATNSGNLSPNADSSASSDDKTRIFDSIPQVAEARNYFQQRWKPPQGLTQSLQYSLVINSDGSIERIIPLTEAAKLYIDRTNIPVPGGQFVSPLQGKSNAQIRVVLNADGKVETLLE
jgi:hypothetical protein